MADSLTNRVLDEKWLTISNWHPSTVYYFRSSKSVKIEREAHLANRNNVRIHPLSSFRWIWESMMAFLYIAYFICSTTKVGFQKPGHYYNSLKFLDIIIFLMDLIFLVEIYMMFNTGYANKYTRTILLDKNTIRRDYLKNYFIIDILSCLPIDIFVTFFLSQKSLWYFLAECLHLIKFLRLFTFLEFLNRFLLKIYRIDCRHMLLMETIIIVLIIHIVSCSYNILQTHSKLFLKNKEEMQLLWNVRFNATKGHNVIFHYRFGVFLAFCNAFQVSSGTILPIQRYELMIFVANIFIVGFMTMRYTKIVVIKSWTRVKTTLVYYNMVRQHKEYMTSLGFPSSYKELINSYNLYVYQRKYFNEEELLKILPDHLRAEVLYESCKAVSENPVFKNVSKVVVANIISRLKYEIYVPGDCITTPGFIGDAMYFIIRGSVVVYTASGKEMCHWKDGDVFGIIPLILKNALTMTLTTTIEMTEIYKLEKDDFTELVLTDETLTQNIKLIAVERKMLTQSIDVEFRKSEGLDH